MPSPRPWSLALVLTFWLVLIIGAALISVPIIALISLVLVPVGAVGLALAVARVPSPNPSARERLGKVLSAAASLFLAGLAVHGAMVGSGTVLAWDRASQPGGGAGSPTAGAGYWLILAGLNLVGIAVLAAANSLRLDRGTNLRLTLLLGSTPLAALLSLFAASRFLPLSA